MKDNTYFTTNSMYRCHLQFHGVPPKKIGLIFAVFLFLSIYPFIIKYYKIQCLTDSSFQDLITCLYSDSKISLD